MPLKGDLSPGDKIREVVLAEKLSMSRAPIREALQILVQEGIVVSKPQIGKQVAQLTAKEIRDSYFTGGVLEAAAVSQALTKYTEEDINDLESVLSEMYHLFKEKGAIENFTNLDNAFHGILFSRIDNQLIIDLCQRSCQGISKFLLHKYWLKIFTPEEVYKRHEAILNALKAGKPARIEKVIRQHYINAGDRMSQYGVDVKKD
jgi:DNA-binding GntR family transcriptional regulator